MVNEAGNMVGIKGGQDQEQEDKLDGRILTLATSPGPPRRDRKWWE